MDKLMTCAIAYQNLLDVSYRCIIGRKGKLKEFTLIFDMYHFHHLAGLHKLSDIPKIRGNRERVFKNILLGELTYDDISESKDFQSIQSRLDYLHELENFMDSNSIIFNYDKRNNPSSRIEAAYLLQNAVDSEILYFFIDKDDYSNNFMGKSFFPKGHIDFTIAQPRWTLLFKEKIDRSNKKNIIQYDKLNSAEFSE